MDTFPPVYPVILCGGDGTRLWPASRKALPKQFMPYGTTTLFKQTLERASALALAGVEVGEPIVVCNNTHRFLAASQLHEVCKQKDEDSPRPTLLLEPFGRNTAPAIALAALHAIRQRSAETAPNGHTDALLLVMPSDHCICNPAPLFDAVKFAIPAASAPAGKLITFGIQPDGPETGYGYIRRGKTDSDGIFDVASFVEKPDRASAQKMLASGEYSWNSGIFFFSASAILKALHSYAPEVLAACELAYAKATHDLDFLRIDSKAFEQCPSISIDYAVMEKAKNVSVIPLAAGWSDLGSWQSFHAMQAHDENGNATLGDTLLEGCKKSMVLAQSRLVTAIGLENMVVIETPDAVMVARQECSQEVKKVVEALKKKKRPEAELHARVYRPWGSYESLIIGDRFQVKRIVVSPGQQLSLQLHFHRAEHWVVVRGTARVTVGEDEILLTEDESTYIPVGSRHRLENPGKVPLEIIEIQTGSYLGEDDIVRLEDQYGRE